MGLFHFLIVVQAIVSAALVGVILMQRSEGGGLGMGGSPSGLMSARGAADFMTRMTTILATIFVLLSISLAFVAAREGGSTSLERTELPASQTTAPETVPVPEAAPVPAQVAPSTEVPLDK